MAAYPPPTANLPIFDDSVFTAANNEPLTITTAAKYFLKYPNAQGDENLQGVNVAGLATFNGNINANFNIVSQTPSFATTTTSAQGQYYLNMTSTSTNADGGVLKLSNSVSGGAVSLGATTTNGLNINRGILIGNNNTGNANTVAMASDQTTNNQLNITGGVSVSNTQSYPQASSQLLATLSYVNSAISGIANLLTSNNVWSGTNAFNTSTPTTTITQTYPQSTSTTQFSTIGYVNGAIASLPNTGAPVGTIQMFAGNTTAPTNYLFCDGTSVSTTTYATLFSIIGYTYGGAGGSFLLPNFHNGSYGVMPIGSTTLNGDGVATDPGISGFVAAQQIYNSNTTLITANQLAPHTHTIAPPDPQYCYGNNAQGNTTVGGSAPRVSGNLYANQPTTTSGMTNFAPTTYNQNQSQYYPSFCSVMFIIKYI